MKFQFSQLFSQAWVIFLVKLQSPVNLQSPVCLQRCTPIKQSLNEEQLALFKQRFKNGYNLYMDSDYVTWLHIHHPESLPEDLHEYIPIPEIPACINPVDGKTNW